MDRDIDPISSQHRLMATQQADLSRLRHAIATIEEHHSRANTGLVLNPPVDELVLEEFEERLDCKLPLELRALWQWHNGEKTERFIWYHRFLSIEESLQQYEELASDEWWLWDRHWVPVFEFQEEWYGVECSEEGVFGSPVVHYFIEQEPAVSHTNLTAYMGTMAEAMDTGAIWWDSIAWENNIRELAAIHSKHNIGIAFPYYVP